MSLSILFQLQDRCICVCDSLLSDVTYCAMKKSLHRRKQTNKQPNKQEDRRISAKSIAEQLGISREQVGSFIHEDWDMREISLKWVPKRLDDDQKRQRCQSYKHNLELFRCDPNDFLSRLAPMEETWLYHYGPETKQQSIEWRHSGSRHPKYPKCKKTQEMFSSRFFGIETSSSLLIIFHSAILSTQSITSLLVELKDILKEKRRPREGHQEGLFLA